MLPPRQVWTVGHSTHPLATFVALVRAHGVTTIADVRKLPRSRRHPHFNVDTLPDALAAAGLGYTHFAGLGGLRHEQPDSINRAWKNPSFRARLMESGCSCRRPPRPAKWVDRKSTRLNSKHAKNSH